MSTVPLPAVSPAAEFELRERLGARALLTLVLTHPTAAVGISIVIFYILVALIGPVLSPQDPTTQHLPIRLAEPSASHLLGTDSLGRDLLSRILFGARISMLSAIGTVIAAAIVGSAAGTVAGFYGGILDDLVMRTTDVFLAFPGLILAMAIAAILKPSLSSALVAVVVVWWPTYARLIRAQVLSVKTREYVEAARALGAGNLRIVLRHILPNAFGPVLIQATLDIGTITLTIAGLSFIGFGAQPPTPEWGLMISEGRNYLQTEWWIPTIPAAAMVVMVLGFNMAGDGLQDLLDPRRRQE